MPREEKTFKVEDAQLIFRNFSGEKSGYNKDGKRKFSVVLDHGMAEILAADGWAVKYTRPREEGEDPTPFITITVNFDNRPPLVMVLTSTSRTRLTKSSVEMLDWADIETVDLIATAYNWEVGDKSGVAAYLKTMFVTVSEDDLERKYAISGTVD